MPSRPSCCGIICSASPQQEMTMIFAIGGAAKLLIPEQSEERIRMTIHLIDRVIHG